MELHHYQQLIKEISAQQAKLVAVSKTKPAAEILRLYQYGQRAFGENRAQELSEKQTALPQDIEWHMIGHLQTNKVKFIAPFVHLIHSIDSFRVLKEVNKEAQKNNRVIDCLLQLKIAAEDTKYGFDLQMVNDILKSEDFRDLQYVRICGLMGMATFTNNELQVRKEFRQLKQAFTSIKKDYFPDTAHFKEISMGMSGDYQLALEEGSTIVRIGSLLFGAR
ncbi:MAG: YggS family pyridoxal phosphate enzyme [Saprospiraceae bacterium]|nr:MAG: YggS family pyridoxal phosphate enzyme [Saprospiraceae bacterium]